LDAIAAYKELFKGDTSYFMAIAKAHFSFMYWMFFVKRTTPKPKKASAKLLGCYNGSIIWQYFIKKRKLFSEIILLK
jgi:hypothetical protein